jgi:N-acetylglutamate synthase-like GNAT family acetyltransferase
MLIRGATIQDVPALHALIESAYRGDSARRGWTHEADMLGGQRTDQDALAEMLADPMQRILVAEVDGALAGSVQVQSRGVGLAYLGQLAVDPDQQASGIGSRLIEAAEALAVNEFSASIMEMTVIVQRTELTAYYVRRGYRETGEMRAFPFDNARIGVATRRDLAFTVLEKVLRSPTP